MGNTIKRYLENSSIHGIRYLVEDGFHWTERLFWLIICALCWCGCAIMIQDSLDGYYHRPVAFTAESTYLDWQTELPSLSVCIRPHPKALSEAANIFERKFGTAVVSNAFTWMYSNSITRSRSAISQAMQQLTDKDIVQIYKTASVNCSTIMDTCYWREEKFQCCDEFKPLRTGNGLCYMLNSKYTNRSLSSSRDKYVMNRTTGIGELLVGFSKSSFRENTSLVVISVQNNLEIPTSAEKSDRELLLTLGKVTNVYLSVVDSHNDPGLRYVPPSRRGCRFASETDNFYAYQYYSNDGCAIQIQMENMLDKCNCVSHRFPYGKNTPVCNYTGLQCIQKYYESIMAKEDLGKYCLSDCDGMVIRPYQSGKLTEVKTSSSKISQGISLRLLALPTLRHKRYVVRSLLDLVGLIKTKQLIYDDNKFGDTVAVGSAVGLFMGAGILSLVEIPYWLLLRQRS